MDLRFMDDFIAQKDFGEREAHITYLTFGRARLHIGIKNELVYEDEW